LPTKTAKMQDLNWNDLRYLLAVSRRGTLSAAAKLLRVDDTTVARRLRALEEKTGARLHQRLADGILRLTPFGERAALHAERIEREVGLLDAALSREGHLVAGTVRITSVPILVNQILLPKTADLLAEHPGLHLEVIADARILSLTRRETDIALRLARPKTGGTRVTTRRIGALHYEVYAAAHYSPREANKLAWITYDESMAHLPQARWIASAAGGEDVARARVNDSEAALAAVAAGLGRSLLPRAVADHDPRLKRLSAKPGGAPVTRELWLLVHSELRRLERIEAVIAWLEQIAPR
jgi:DNA-binding transcriptional LysR family regulator